MCADMCADAGTCGFIAILSSATQPVFCTTATSVCMCIARTTARARDRHTLRSMPTGQHAGGRLARGLARNGGPPTLSRSLSD